MIVVPLRRQTLAALLAGGVALTSAQRHPHHGHGVGGGLFLGDGVGDGGYAADGAQDPTSPALPHVGCAAFLKTNHQAQDLPAVNAASSTSSSAGTLDGADVDGADASANAVVTCQSGFADVYPCSNLDLQSFLPLSILSPDDPAAEGNDIWGWTHSGTGREFALMGLTTGTAVAEVTDPVNPRYLGFLRTKTECSSWRDVKVHADHMLVVSEASGHGMQSFDLTTLLDVADGGDLPLGLLETAHYGGFGNAHNIVMNEDSGYAYAVGTNTYSGGLHFIDVSDPTNPVGAGGYSGDGYTHDAQCVNYSGPDDTHAGKEICFCYNEDTLTIVDVTVKSNPVRLGRVGYQGSRYTHQGWIVESGTHVVVNDEVDESGSGPTKTHVFNVEDLDNPTYVGFHEGTTTARDHNLYIKGDLVFESNYRAGLQVLRIDDLSTASFTQLANFDIYPSSDGSDYNGSWSNYPYFPSGTIVVSGIEQGLYVLRTPNDFGRSGSVRRKGRDLADDEDYGGGAVAGRAVANVEKTPAEKRRALQEAGCTTVQDFEAATPGGTDGWTTGGTCTTGTFVVGTPSQVIDSCVLTQAGGDHTTGSGQCLYTAPNTGAGTDDVDGGECNAVSPAWSVSVDSVLSAWYWFGQRTTGDDSGDYFFLELSIDGGAWTTLDSIGDETSQAIWRDVEANVPGGSSVQLRIRASDGTTSGDLVEAAIDDILICPLGTLAPTTPPTPSPTDPTRAPTAAPTSPPTLSTPRPTMAPTPLVVTVKKYICKKTDPGENEICLNGSTFPDTSCDTVNGPCGNGGKICQVAETCPSDGPNPTPTPPPPAPTCSGYTDETECNNADGCRWRGRSCKSG